MTHSGPVTKELLWAIYTPGVNEFGALQQLKLQATVIPFTTSCSQKLDVRRRVWQLLLSSNWRVSR